VDPSSPFSGGAILGDRIRMNDVAGEGGVFIRSLATRGALGGLSGAATELNPSLILARRANIQGISVGSTQMFQAMARAIEINAIKPAIDKVFAFAEAQAAYRHMASGAHFGKIVIRVG
jgi:NADPH:quinone reductase-like Zn-dependent oxidoreductase